MSQNTLACETIRTCSRYKLMIMKHSLPFTPTDIVSRVFFISNINYSKYFANQGMLCQGIHNWKF